VSEGEAGPRLGQKPLRGRGEAKLGLAGCHAEGRRESEPSGQNKRRESFPFSFLFFSIQNHFQIILNPFEFWIKTTHHNKPNAPA
jgi:hypothetical protein